MSPHTPGPWKVGKQGKGYLIFNDMVRHPHGGFALEYPVRTGIDDEANARLIAKAPEMLEALHIAEDALAQLVVEVFQAPHRDRALAQICALLREIEGKTP